MITQKRVLGLVGAGALLMGMMLGTTGAVFADGSISWTGQGTTDGVLNKEQCDNSNTPYLLFVFTPGGNDSITGGTLHLGGSGTGDYAISSDQGQWKATTPFFDLSTLTASLDYTGDLGNGNANLVISHGCPGEASSSTTSFSSSVESTTDSSSTSSTTSFTGSVESTTDTLPPTDTITTTGTGQQSGGMWLLIAGLGVLLGSVIVLAPAKAKTRR